MSTLSSALRHGHNPPPPRISCTAVRVDQWAANRNDWREHPQHWSLMVVARPDRYHREHIGPTIEAAQKAMQTPGVEVSMGIGHLGQTSYGAWYSPYFWASAGRLLLQIISAHGALGIPLRTFRWDVEPYRYSEWADRSRKYPRFDELYHDGIGIRDAMRAFIEPLAAFDEVVIEQGHPDHLFPYLFRLNLPARTRVIAAGNEMKFWPYCVMTADSNFAGPVRQYRALSELWSRYGIEYRPTVYMRGVADQAWSRKFADQVAPVFNGFFAGNTAMPEFAPAGLTREGVYKYGQSDYLELIDAVEVQSPDCANRYPGFDKPKDDGSEKHGELGDGAIKAAADQGD